MRDVLFEKYRLAFIGKPLNAVWRGYGSALFLELGKLSFRTKRDGSVGNATGEYGVMIQWSWRIENETSILCGSWSDEPWDAYFESLVGRTVENVSVFGRLPELSVQLSGGFYVVSFMTAEDQPAWALFDQTLGIHSTRFLNVENGRICEHEGKDKAL